MADFPHVPAAFINAIADEGTKKEAVEWLQKIWNELCATKNTLVVTEAALAVSEAALKQERGPKGRL